MIEDSIVAVIIKMTVKKTNVRQDVVPVLRLMKVTIIIEDEEDEPDRGQDLDQDHEN